MAWPLTGSALTKYNRLLSDLRQYGDFIFVGAPDDITWLQETIVAASDGQLRPPLDDVANRSHYWMLRTIAFLGDSAVVTPATPCPECPPVVTCPPCPPCPPITGIDWGPDDTTLDVTTNSLDIALIINNSPAVTSVVLPSLQTLTGGDLLAENLDFLESFSAPELVNVPDGGIFLDVGISLVNVSFPKLTFVFMTVDIMDTLPIVSAEFPSLVSVGTDGVARALYAAYFCPNLVSVSYPVLTTVGGPLRVQGCLILPSVSFPALATVGGNVLIELNAGLVTVDIPVFLPFDGQLIFANGNALSAASVNHILARCVANAGYVSGTVDLSGGTNAAPTGQGITDKADLIARGVTVSTN